MYTFRRFIGCVCTLGCLFCTLATTQLTTFATEVTTVTDTWIPLDEAWDTVGPLYDTYNTALSEDSGITITEDNYQEYVIKSIIGNFVATHEAYGEDVSLDGLLDVIMADADLFNALGSATLVNPLNGAYYLGEAMGASLRSSIDNFLESTFGLTDIMTTSEAVGLDFPEGRVFVMEEDTSSEGITIGSGTWYYVAPGSTVVTTAGSYQPCVTNNSSVDMYFTTIDRGIAICTWEPFVSGVYLNYGYGYQGYSNMFLVIGTSYNGYYAIYQTYSAGIYWDGSYDTYSDAYIDFYGNELPETSDPEYTDPIVIINDEDPPIISPTSVYNDWSSISNYNYDTYYTDYVTYNTGDSIYNYTYYYNINNYTDDMPLWVVNGKNLPVYEFDRETFYDFSNQNYTVSDDLVWDSSFFDFVWEYLPEDLTIIIITMLVASAFFLLFKH